jgi:hypothetical protein
MVGGCLPGGYRVLQCYTAWPAYAKSRSRVLHRVLQSATQGATFSKSNAFDAIAGRAALTAQDRKS